MTLSGRFEREHSPANKHSEEKINQVIQHIKSVPKYKPHRKEGGRSYCTFRSSTQTTIDVSASRNNYEAVP